MCQLVWVVSYRSFTFHFRRYYLGQKSTFTWLETFIYWMNINKWEISFFQYLIWCPLWQWLLPFGSVTYSRVKTWILPRDVTRDFCAISFPPFSCYHLVLCTTWHKILSRNGRGARAQSVFKKRLRGNQFHHLIHHINFRKLHTFGLDWKGIPSDSVYGKLRVVRVSSSQWRFTRISFICFNLGIVRDIIPLS